MVNKKVRLYMVRHDLATKISQCHVTKNCFTSLAPGGSETDFEINAFVEFNDFLKNDQLNVMVDPEKVQRVLIRWNVSGEYADVPKWGFYFASATSMEFEGRDHFSILLSAASQQERQFLGAEVTFNEVLDIQAT